MAGYANLKYPKKKLPAAIGEPNADPRKPVLLVIILTALPLYPSVIWKVGYVSAFPPELTKVKPSLPLLQLYSF